MKTEEEKEEDSKEKERTRKSGCFFSLKVEDLLVSGRKKSSLSRSHSELLCKFSHMSQVPAKTCPSFVACATSCSFYADLSPLKVATRWETNRFYIFLFCRTHIGALLDPEKIEVNGAHCSMLFRLSASSRYTDCTHAFVFHLCLGTQTFNIPLIPIFNLLHRFLTFL